MPDPITGAEARDVFADDGADPSEAAADTESCWLSRDSCWLSRDSDVVEVDSGGASDAGALTASGALTALDVVFASSTEAVFAVPSRVGVASAVSEVGLVWVSPPPAARFAVAGAGSEDVDVEPHGEPDADDPGDLCVDGDAEDFTEPEERDVDPDPDDADEIVEGESEEASEGDAGPAVVEFESVGSAEATPCPVNTAAPTPRATASPPTLPTYAAALISFTFLGMLRDRTNRIAVTCPNEEQDH